MLDQIRNFLEVSAQPAARRLRRAAILGGIAGLCALTALGFGTAAVYIALSESIGPVGACASLAGFYGLVGVIIVLAGFRHEPPVRPQTETDAAAVGRLTAAFVTGFRAGNGRPLV